MKVLYTLVFGKYQMNALRYFGDNYGFVKYSTSLTIGRTVDAALKCTLANEICITILVEDGVIRDCGYNDSWTGPNHSASWYEHDVQKVLDIRVPYDDRDSKHRAADRELAELLAKQPSGPSAVPRSPKRNLSNPCFAKPLPLP